MEITRCLLVICPKNTLPTCGFKKMAFYQPVVLFVNGLLPTCVLTITLTQSNLKTY